MPSSRGGRRADNAAVTLAVRRRAAYLPCDDRIVRGVAAAEGVRPIGTLGVLLRAVSRGYLRRTIARRDIDHLIRLRGFSISIEVYQEVLRRLEQGS